MINNRKAQVTVFVIIAILLVAGILVFFAFRGQLFGENIPEEFRPIYNLYSGCIEQETEIGLDILGSQGGRIDIGDYTPGSAYSPLSSHLTFLGISIPYWYSLTGNNLVSEDVPSLSDMEEELEVYLENRINECDFNEFYEQGFFIETNDLENRISVDIETDSVLVSVNSPLVSQREDRSARKSNHNIEVSSKMGKFYEISRDVYDTERNELFLENYAVDVLQNYAPVDGVEIQCSPLIWKTPEVVEDIKTGLQANFGAIKVQGDYYRLDDEEDDYFVQDIGSSVESRELGTAQVNFYYFPEEFPSKIEVSPASQTLMVAEPVGTQEGLGVMGFCYVPYHFVYDLSLPVLVQVTDGEEVFQYPISVVIDNNFPIESDILEIGNPGENPEVDVCSFAEGDVQVKTYDVNLNPVEAEISYNCFDNFCPLGSTEISGIDSVLDSEIPVCVNGYLIANAEGYAEKKILFSSNSESNAEIILDREYEVEVVLRIGGQEVESGTATVHFERSDGSGGFSAIIPDEPQVTLTEGLYDIQVFAYGDSNVNIPSTTKTECFEVASGGLLGFFGSTEEECVNVEIPAFNIDYALKGGGKTTTFILESDLQQGSIVIDISELPEPNSIEQLQYNYEVFETLGVQVGFE